MSDTERKYLKPADGLKIRNPETGRHMPPDGEWVSMDTYWRRRLRDGDVTASRPTRAPAAANGTNKSAKQEG